MKELEIILNQYLPEETAEKLSVFLDKDMLILIDGRQETTGKTKLCNALNGLGYHAEEVWEHQADKKSDSNTVSVTITLNQSVR